MNHPVLAAIAALLLAFGPSAAASPDLHDADATFEAFKASQQSSYEAVDAQYQSAIADAPDDVALAIARCRFIENFSFAEDIDWSEEASSALDACRETLALRWPTAASARVYQLEYTRDEDALPLAEQLWADSARWSRVLRAQVAGRLHELYADRNDDKAGDFAVIAARLGNAQSVAAGIRQLADQGKRDQAVKLASDSTPASETWMALQRIKALGEMGDAGAARREMDRSIAAGAELSAATRVKAYIADHDLRAANQAARDLGEESESSDARFELALANGKLADARSMVEFEPGIGTWASRYSEVVAKQPWSALGASLLPFTLVLVLCVLAFALLPGLLLVPVHYRGLARRVQNRAPLPLFPAIGLRHAWIASGFLLIIPAFAIFVLRPDAIGPLLAGGEENASTQLSVLAAGTVLTLLALLPWLRGLSGPAVAGHHVLSPRTVGVVVACWALVFSTGVISALVHQALIGGDSSTEQTRTVETIIHNGATQYGLLVTLGFVAGLVPIVEEAVFRGMLLGGMARHISFGWANTLQALLFALSHDDPPRFLFYLTMGLVGGWLVRRYRSLWPTIALHALNNSVATLLQHFG